MVYKTILLGESGVGKTSLFIRLTQDSFNDSVGATLQMDIGRKVVSVRPPRLDFQLKALEGDFNVSSAKKVSDKVNNNQSDIATAPTTPASTLCRTSS